MSQQQQICDHLTNVAEAVNMQKSWCVLRDLQLIANWSDGNYNYTIGTATLQLTFIPTLGVVHPLYEK